MDLLEPDDPEPDPFFLGQLWFWFNGDRDYWLWEFHTFQDDRCIFHTGVTGGYVFQTDRSRDVASANFFDLFTFVRVHLNDTTDTISLTFNGVQYGITRVNHTRIATEEGQVTNERVGAILNASAENGSSSLGDVQRSIFTVVQMTVRSQVRQLGLAGIQLPHPASPEHLCS